jgi:hypothetical protein
METLGNITSISQTLKLVEPNQLKVNNFYVLKFRTTSRNRMNYIVIYIGNYNFVKIYERKPRELILNFNKLNSRQWSIVDEPLSKRTINLINNYRSEIYQIPSLNPDIIKDLKNRSVNKNVNVNVNTLNKNIMGNLLTCPICLLKLKNKVLICGHAFCSDCTKELCQKSPIKCPICNKEIKKNDIANLFL